MPRRKPIPHHQPGYKFMNPQIPPTPHDRERIIMARRSLVHHPTKDLINTSDVKVPDTVVILGSGPKGRAAWRKIPADAYVIAVNEGVNACIDYPDECAFTPAMWIVNDRHVPENDYFFKADKTFKGLRVFGDVVMNVLLGLTPFPEGQLEAAKKGRVLRFHRGPFHKWEKGPWVHHPDLFIPGGTVCSAALWIAYMKGPAKRAYLCGIDMSKDLHYGGGKEPKTPDHRHGEVWKSVPHLNKVIEHYASIGMKCYTLSETKLQSVKLVERIT